MSEENAKTHFVNLASVDLPGYYVMKTETRAGVERTVVRADLTILGDGSCTLRMYYAYGEDKDVSPLVSDMSTYFGPLPLE
jgi:hypothetical protein